MSRSSRDRGSALAFEEIPARLRPAIVANYMCLLDEGFLAPHITFRRYGDVFRVEASYPDGRPGTSRPACPRGEPVGEPDCSLTGGAEERSEFRARRKALFEQLEGTRVRASWPGGHERIGVIERRDRFTYELRDIEWVRLRPDTPLPALEPFTHTTRA
jgi:hypothetical protein